MDAESQHVASLQAELEEIQAEHIQWLKSRQVPATPLQVEAFQETQKILVQQIDRRNQIIRDLMAWIENEYTIDDVPPGSPGRKLWDRAQEATR